MLRSAPRPVAFTKYLFNKLNINRGMGDGQTEKPDGVSCLIFSLRIGLEGKGFEPTLEALWEGRIFPR